MEKHPLFNHVRSTRDYLTVIGTEVKRESMVANDPVLQSLSEVITKKTRATNLMLAAIKGQRLSEIETPPSDPVRAQDYYRHVLNILDNHVFFDETFAEELDNIEAQAINGLTGAVLKKIAKDYQEDLDGVLNDVYA